VILEFLMYSKILVLEITENYLILTHVFNYYLLPVVEIADPKLIKLIHEFFYKMLKMLNS
jgi:hypothetical protein